MAPKSISASDTPDSEWRKAPSVQWRRVCLGFRRPGSSLEIVTLEREATVADARRSRESAQSGFAEKHPRVYTSAALGDGNGGGGSNPFDLVNYRRALKQSMPRNSWHPSPFIPSRIF